MLVIVFEKLIVSLLFSRKKTLLTF